MIAGAITYAMVAAAWTRSRFLGFLFNALPRSSQAPKTVAAIANYALGATALAYLLYCRVLAMAGSAHLFVVTLLIPPILIAIGAFVRHEAPGSQSVVEFVLLALVLINSDGRAFFPLRRVANPRMAQE